MGAIENVSSEFSALFIYLFILSAEEVYREFNRNLSVYPGSISHPSSSSSITTEFFIFEPQKFHSLFPAKCCSLSGTHCEFTFNSHFLMFRL